MNLNLSLVFDSENKFLLCGELVKFNLKISSPDFSDSSEIKEFMKIIGATVESIELEPIFPNVPSEQNEQNCTSLVSSNSSSIDSLKRKPMKSVESLSTLLRTSSVNCLNINSDHKYTSIFQNMSKDSHGSQSSLCSMTSVTAKRFDSLRSSQAEAIWCSEGSEGESHDGSDCGYILIPLEIFIDPEGLSSNCNKATAKIKVSLNELSPIDTIGIMMNDQFGLSPESNFKIQTPQNSHKLERIGLTEISLLVIRPLDVSLRTQNISSSHAILQINSDFNCENDSEISLEIENAQIILSDSFSSRKNWNNFKISPISEAQVPFTFETSPQQISLLFNWIALDKIDFSCEDIVVRVEFQGKLRKKTLISQISLSFESSIPIFNLFPQYFSTGIQITSVQLLSNLNNILILFEPFQIELIVKNFDEHIGSINFVVENKLGKPEKYFSVSNLDQKNSGNLKEWFKLDESKKCPSLLLISPLKGINIQNIPPNGSKSIRLKFVPVRSGLIYLHEEISFKNSNNNEILKIEPLILQIE